MGKLSIYKIKPDEVNMQMQSQTSGEKEQAYGKYCTMIGVLESIEKQTGATASERPELLIYDLVVGAIPPVEKRMEYYRKMQACLMRYVSELTCFGCYFEEVGSVTHFCIAAVKSTQETEVSWLEEMDVANVLESRMEMLSEVLLGVLAREAEAEENR